ncbi:MAG: methionyl-tRNA formyltransferase [Thermomicrobiales bacterium]|nr:methionyl-tRNA formyltransferase [Thermomicrobiales bacterium]
MTDVTKRPRDEYWRVVVLSNIQGGVVFHHVSRVVRPLGHKVVGVVTTPGPKRLYDPAYLDVVAEAARETEVLVTARPSKLASMLQVWNPDLTVVGGFPWKLPPEVVELPRLGTINIHPSLLPRNRGRYTLEWTFRHGDAETGFTIQRMAPQFDRGPILAQNSVPIEDDDDGASLLDKMMPTLPALLSDAFERVAREEPGEPQDESRATDSPAFEPEWREIDWAQPARAIHNQVRSWTGIRLTPKGAFGDVGGDRLLILRTRLETEEGHESGQPPGTVIDRNAESIVVQTGEGPLRIVEWKGVDEGPETKSG